MAAHTRAAGHSGCAQANAHTLPPQGVPRQDVRSPGVLGVD